MLRLSGHVGQATFLPLPTPRCVLGAWLSLHQESDSTPFLLCVLGLEEEWGGGTTGEGMESGFWSGWIRKGRGEDHDGVGNDIPGQSQYYTPGSCILHDTTKTLPFDLCNQFYNMAPRRPLVTWHPVCSLPVPRPRHAPGTSRSFHCDVTTSWVMDRCLKCWETSHLG